MTKLAGLFGILALVLAITDLIHGQNNGDIHRTYIHVPEFILFMAFLCLAGILIFRIMSKEMNLNRWIVLFFFMIVFGIANFVLAMLSGASFHGDGGPIATSFLLISAISEIGMGVALVGFLVSAIARKNAGFPVLRR
jgi:hypothetical protein